MQVDIKFLNIANYKFKDHFPKEFTLENYSSEDLLKSKLWFIKKKMRHQTSILDKSVRVKHQKVIMPEGLSFHPSLITQKQLDQVYENMNHLFTNVLNGTFKDILTCDQRKDRGLTYLFTGSNEETQYYTKTITQLQTKGYIHLVHLINTYLDYICKLYRVDNSEEFKNQHIQVILLEYQPKTGIWLHIDNIARYDQGPIITISVGQPKVTYDMTPVILDNKDAKPLRITTDEGCMIIMDGSSRMEWTHGLPYDIEPHNGKLKYTVMFKCNKFREEKPRFNKILNHTITSSGV